MSAPIPIEQFSSALDDILNEYKEGVIESADEAVKKAAKEGVNALKANSPRKAKNGGGYAGGWTSKEEKTRLGSTTIIYNGKKPGLAHLLEYGHAVIRKDVHVGDADPHPHIEKIEKELVDRFEKQIRIEIGGR